MLLPTKEELIANQKSVDEICDYLSATSLKYLETQDFEKILKSIAI